MTSNSDDLPTRSPITDFTGSSKRNLVTVYSRHGCHLCDVAFETLTSLQGELDFDLEKLFIDGDEELEKKYGEQIPVIQIDGEHHDFWRVDPDRFRSSLERRRQHR
ncbi:MAG: glutaredoxin family protein [Actinomycetota bacterium]